MATKLTKKAIRGFQWAIVEVELYLERPMSSSKALAKVGIKTWEDTYFFLSYLKENGYKNLFNKLIKKTPINK